VIPFAAGGESTVTNIELRCRAHNQREAELYFGAAMPALVRERAVTYGLGPDLVQRRVVGAEPFEPTGFENDRTTCIPQAATLRSSA
jgi:hypothetical protein